jgi:cytochrome c peroxidase
MRNLLMLTIAAVAFCATPILAADDGAALLQQARQAFRPLPKDIAGPDGPVKPPQVELGRSLFFDPRLTVDGNVSCASCHQPGLYGADGLAKSIGVKQRPHPRNAPTILNAALSIIHWRGDRESVEDQVIKALTSPITFGQPNVQASVDRLRTIPGYLPMFKAAFPGEADPVTAPNIANAIGAFERTLVTPSPFDAYLTGDAKALSPTALKGLSAFMDKGCTACHDGVGIGGTTYQKFGVVEDYWKATASPSIDKGRIDVTQNPDDLYLFRVPSLRNVAMTAPYFHDGSVAALPDAVRVMARVQLGTTLSDSEIADIVAFLQSLTGELPANFATTPVLPPGVPKPPK